MFIAEAPKHNFKCSTEEIDLMKQAVHLLAHGAIKSVAIDFFGGLKANLFLDASDNIKVKRIKSLTETQIVTDK